ncbi:MAG: hypothetical protein N2738_04105 [Thermodesulfovibrionales bacterium]|nr:hypothetical protein [Thermodesulfovibrionales bacterium]
MTLSIATEILYDLMYERQSSCPFIEDDTSICKASSMIALDEIRKDKYCYNEDYEDCPIFLVKRLNGNV